MRKFSDSLLAVGVGILAFASPAKANVSPTEPYMVVREIMAMQDRLSHGDKSALQKKKILQSEANKSFETMPSEVWQQPRNAIAAAMFMIIGGSASTFRSLLGKGIDFGKHDAFVKGAIAYREKTMAVAKKQFMSVEYRDLDRIAAACLLLVKAILNGKDGPENADKDFAMVGTLVPGSYLEDTAIRMQAAYAVAEKRDDVFLSLLSRYLRRFHKSLYADAFLTDASKEIHKMNPDDVTVVAEKQIKSLESVPDKIRISILLKIAEVELRHGNLNSADAFSQAAGRIRTSDSKVAISSELYTAAASVFKEASVADQIAKKYQSRRDNLTPDYGELSDAIVAIVQKLHAPIVIDQGQKFEPTAVSIEANKLRARSKDLLSIGEGVRK